MEILNETVISYFILKGFSGGPALFNIMLGILWLVYLATLAGNFLMIIIISFNYSLHSPMYFFLVSVSVLETFGISAIIPQLLFVLGGRKIVSLSGCYTQCYIYFLTSSSVFLLLSIMSIDRYLAICSPLRYPSIMSHKLCVILISVCVMIPFVVNSSMAIVFVKLPLCGYVIDHFFCDSAAILKLVCVGVAITFFTLSAIITSIFNLVIPLIITVISYMFIVYTIVKIPSEKGRQKTFSTCVSHLTMVSIVFGSAIFIQIRPPKGYSILTDKIINLVSTAMAPLLNPFIYTLRNQQVKDSIRDTVKRKMLLSSQR